MSRARETSSRLRNSTERKAPHSQSAKAPKRCHMADRRGARRTTRLAVRKVGEKQDAPPPAHAQQQPWLAHPCRKAGRLDVREPVLPARSGGENPYLLASHCGRASRARK